MICGVSALQIIEHQVTVTQSAPSFTIFGIESESLLIQFCGLEENITRAVSVGEFENGIDIVGSVANSQIIRGNSFLVVAE